MKIDQAECLKELEPESAKLNRLLAELSLVKQILKGCGRGRLLSPERRRGAVNERKSYQLSKRHARRRLEQRRHTQRYEVLYRTDEDALAREIVALASKYGRYGYRRITTLLRDRCWHLGKDRVQRISRREGLKLPPETKPARQVVVERRIVPSVAAGTSEPCVELRFRECDGPRRRDAADANAD